MEDSIITRLRTLNFDTILKLEETENYNFEKYLKNGNEKGRHNLKGFCTLCEEKNINSSINDSGFKLRNISHGAHTIDFQEALGEHGDLIMENWHEKSVMFVFESPSSDYGIYETLNYENHEKRPSKDWYWVHEKLDYKKFPEEFKGKTYGSLVQSAINTFKLKNGYITNLIKCGMNDESGQKYEGIGNFRQECIKNCYENILKKEIEILNPSVIFCFGSNVYNSLWYLINEDEKYKGFIDKLYDFPHPAGARRGFKDVFYKSIYFWRMVEGLYKQGVITKEYTHKLLEIYLEDK